MPSTGSTASSPESGTADDRTTDLDEQLCFALYAATNSIIRVYRPMLDELGITYPQYLVLLVLWHDGSCTIGQLAERLQLTAPAVSPIIDRLRAHSLVTRRRDRQDRRVVHVTLTAEGKALEPAAAAIQREVGCRTSLGDAEVASLRTELQALNGHLTADQAGADSTPH